MRSGLNPRWWLTGVLALGVIGIMSLGPLAGTSWAQQVDYYAGNHYTCWGIKADISTPASPFYVDGSDFVPSYVSTIGWQKPGTQIAWYFCQIGYDYQPSVYPNARSYAEWFDIQGNYNVAYMSDQAWNFTRNYEVQYIGSEGYNGRVYGEWESYVNGVPKYSGFTYDDGALDLNAYTEAHDTASVMNGIFNNVSKRSQANLWYLFDHLQWVQDSPYYVTPLTNPAKYDTAG